MEDGPLVEGRLGGAEQDFNLKQVAIAQNGLERRDLALVRSTDFEPDGFTSR